MKRAWKRILLPALLVLALVGLVVWPAAAHTGGRLQLSAVTAGPFKLSVWTSPDPARVGELHVATAVTLAEDASPALDAAVAVQLEPLEGAVTTLSAPATTDNSDNKFLYEAILQLDEVGLYQVTIDVTGADGAAGQATFELEVVSAAGFAWVFIPFLLGALVVLGGYLYWRSRPAQE